METLIAFLITSALAQDVPLCATPPIAQCPPDMASCTLSERCIDAQGCTHNRIIYQQDCSADPKPNYCSSNAPAQNWLVLRDRKTCPRK